MPIAHLPSSRQSGFTLIELAIVILISGLMLASAITLASLSLQKIQYDETQEKLEKIADSLAIYVHEYGRLPCPANPGRGVGPEPYGSPRNSVDGAQISATCGATVIPPVGVGGVLGVFGGIVPFRALGLKEEDVKDAWGNFITYKAAPILTGRDADSQGGFNLEVHRACRQPRWIDTIAGVNLNPAKASFCCPRFDTPRNGDIWVRDPNNQQVYLQTQSITSGDFTFDTTAAAINNATVPDTNSEIMAFVLISHGVGGTWAYSGNANPLIGNVFGFDLANPDQELNVGNINQSYTAPYTRQANIYFDDRLYWLSNRQLINRFNNNTCARP